jgi:hypothetical protein
MIHRFTYKCRSYKVEYGRNLLDESVTNNA